MHIKEDAWVISDTHFGHKNIINYADRPFKTVEEMDKAMIDKWNSIVSPADQVIFLGDFALANGSKIENYEKQLNGSISIILGNHDRKFEPRWWLDAGFQEVSSHPVVYKDFFILSHEPIEWVTERLPVLNIHGHVHEKTAYNLANHHYNVSVEALNYAPMRLADIVQLGRDFSAI